MPKETHGTPVLVRMHEDLLKALDDYRRASEDLPSRPEAVRRLISEVLMKED